MLSRLPLLNDLLQDQVGHLLQAGRLTDPPVLRAVSAADLQGAILDVVVAAVGAALDLYPEGAGGWHGLAPVAPPPSLGHSRRMETRDPDIVALADPHNVEFWRAHPDVEKVEQLHLDTEADGPSVELSIWLRPGAADEPFEVPVMGEEPPERESDLFLGGRWLLHRQLVLGPSAEPGVRRLYGRPRPHMVGRETLAQATGADRAPVD